MNINSKSTKAEIIAAYKELEKQKNKLESEFKQSAINKAKLVANSNPISKPNKHLSSDRSQQDVAQTIQALTQIKNNFGGAVSNLSEKLIQEATQLENVRKEITQETIQLKELHQIEQIQEATLEQLIEQYQEDAKKLAEQLNQAQENSQQEIQTLEYRWLKEKETHARFIQTRNEEQRKTQQREKEEYEYNLDLARDLDEEEYEQEKKLRQQELELARQTLEQEWQEKEAAIAKQEQEYQEAQDKVATFETKLEAKIKQGKEEGKAIGSNQAKIKADLREKEIVGETQNYQLKIESLEATIRHQDQRIKQLNQQLDTALKQVQDLAVKAIEGTSNRNSFEAMKAIAMEQAKTQQKGK